MFRWRRNERELHEEIEFHLAQAERKYGSRTRAAALLGGEDAAKEACRDERRGAWLSSVGRDLRLGARILRKSPGYTAAAVITLALCIGAIAAVFSVIDVSMLQTPPFPQPDRMVTVVSVEDGGPAFGHPLPAADVADFRAGASAFAELAAYNRTNANLAAAGHAAHVSALEVTPAFFQVLGAAAARGRTFLPSEAQAGQDHVAILSHDVWQTQLDGAPLLGKTVKLDGIPFTVVGMMPRGFAANNYGAYGRFATGVYVPLDIPAAARRHTRAAVMSVFAIGRLRPGATVAEARAQVSAIAARNAARYPYERGLSVTAMTLNQDSRQRSGNLLLLGLFMGLAVLILLIGCTNVAGLELGRAAARGDEMAMRRALGASRARLVRQVLTENALLALLAGALGLLVGWLGMRALNAAFGQAFMRMDGNVLAATLTAVVITALVAGLPPALRLGTRAQARGVIGARCRGRSALVGVEVGLTAACLITMAAMVISAQEHMQRPMGFDAAQTLTANIALRGPSYQTAAGQARFAARLRADAAALPGVTQAALISPPPLDWSAKALDVRGRAPLDGHKTAMPDVFAASVNYLAMLRIPLTAGRPFTAADSAAAPPVAIISRRLAQRLFPNTKAIGQVVRVESAGEPWREIVGVCGNVARFPGDTEMPGAIYEPLQQAPLLAANLGVLLRTAVPPGAMIAPLRRALRQIDPTLALFGAQSLATELWNWTGVQNVIFIHVLELMACLALLLSALGLYSIVAYTAAARRREIGIRSALGADVGQLQRLLLRGGGRLTLIGLACGCLVGWLGVQMVIRAAGTIDVPLWLLLLVPELFLGVMAALAIYCPARRAARADVLAALRVE